jgi:hypothetical protein
MTSTTTPARSRQLAANAIGRPLLTMIQTMLAGPGSTTPSAGAKKPWRSLSAPAQRSPR